MRAYIVTLAFLFLFVGCKGDEKTAPPEPAGEPAVEPAGGPSRAESERVSADPGRRDAPPTGAVGADAPPADAAIAIVDRAIEAAGGLEALTEKFAAYTVKSKGLYIGTPYEMTTLWAGPDRMYMAIEPGAMVMGTMRDGCWTVMNGIVVDCAPEEAKNVPTQLYLARVEGLYILKQPAYRFESKGPGEINGRATQAVEVTHPDAPVPVWMEFYADTGLLARTRYAGSFAGTEGPVVHDILTYRAVDGVQVPLKSVVSAGGKVYVEDMMQEISWGVDEALFERPSQRATGVPTVRELDAQTVAHVIHEGAYEGLGGTLGPMMAWATEAGLDIMGPPTFVYLTSPGQTPDPAMYRTEIRLPVMANRDLTAAHPVYSIKRVEPMTVAVRLEKGSYDQAAAAIDPLAAWCGENGYAVAGPPMMTGYMDPATTAPEALLSEILLPVMKTR